MMDYKALRVNSCLRSIVFVSAITSFTWAAASPQTSTAKNEKTNLLSLTNPNLTVKSPTNQNLGSITVDTNLTPSSWHISQWHTPPALILRPDKPPGNYVDPYASGMGRAVYAQMTKNSRLAVFSTSDGLVFELGSAHGKSTLGGGQNLFLETSVSNKTPVNSNSMIDLCAAVPFLQMAPSKDNSDAGQVFIGAVFDPINRNATARNLFIQIVIADNRGARILTPPPGDKDGAIYASSNPEVGGAGVINFPLVRGNCALIGTTMTPVHINLFKYLKKAVTRRYEWTDGSGARHTTIYPPELQDPSMWTLAGVYMGNEVQGPNGNATTRFSNIAVQP